MKWILALTTLAGVAYPMHKASTPEPTPEKTYPAPKGKIAPAPAYDADLFKKDVQGYAGHIELLGWTIAAGPLDYALIMNNPSWGPSPSYAVGEYQTAGFDFEPGFRAALSYFRAPHYWEIKWEYTRMTLNGHDSCSKPAEADHYLTATFPDTFETPIINATSSTHFNYNVFDWSVDRVFFPNPHLRIRALCAMSMAWMQQNWIVRYTNATPSTTTVNNYWGFFGAGFKTGTVIDWYWTGDLYMTAQATIGSLLGTYTNKFSINTTNQPNGDDNPTIPVGNARYHDVRSTLTLQFLLGPSWQKNYEKTRIELFAGYETNIWLNLEQVYRSGPSNAFGPKITSINNGILTLYGLTTRCTFSF